MATRAGPLWWLVASVAALAVAGGFLAARLPGVGEPEAVRPEARTSFGRLSVQQVEFLPGLTAKDLAGVTHGFPFVGAKELQVQVSVRIRNDTGRRIGFDPRRFRLRAGRVTVLLVSSTLRRGVLDPGSVEATLAFAAPRSIAGSPLRLELGSARVDLGRSSAVPPPASGGDGHDHEHDTS